MSNNVVNSDSTIERESFTELLGQLAGNLATVICDGIKLEIQKIREEAATARKGVFIIVIGAAISFVACLTFCTAVIIGLTSYMTPVMAAVVTGLALAVIGAVFIYIGYTQLKKSNLEI